MAAIGDSRAYFSYGSNMSVAQMSMRCPTARFDGVARLRDYRFHINLHGVATVLRSPGEVVHGVLWRLMPRDEASLDAYEGVELDVYRRVFLPVEREHGVRLPALVYVATETTPGRPVPDYLASILACAKSLNFPAHYCCRLASCDGRSLAD